MYSIAESVDHVEDRIGMRYHLPDRWEHRDRVEHSSEIGERCEDKIRNDRCRVETISHESVEESDERKKKRSEQCKYDRESDMSKCDMCKKHRYSQYNSPSDHTTDDSSSDETKDDDPVWSR
jgi:hypothetical protein